MASYRHLARTCVMQTLFVHEFHGGDPVKILEDILDEFAPKLTGRDFARTTLAGIIENKNEILKIIAEHAPQWPVDKIAKVDRAILEIGVYEIVCASDIPPVVAINEAVEIAKHFGDESSPKFVNGVLSTIMKKYHGEIPKTGKKDRD
ncbi:transcription antitermination factor NusB [Candidatus Peregrinibacteria bacterium]|nr:transcription antitermination factor NusB [Candidatus Peregrinibacteria bacterium]